MPRPPITAARRLLAPSLSAALLACGGGSAGGPSAPGTERTGPVGPTPGGTSAGSNAVTVSNNAFTPDSLAVAVGATVTWTWDSCTGEYGGESCTSHNVTFDQGGPSSGTQSSGTFSRAFTTAGTHPYRCTIHGAAMSGRVVVR